MHSWLKIGINICTCRAVTSIYLLRIVLVLNEFGTSFPNAEGGIVRIRKAVVAIEPICTGSMILRNFCVIRHRYRKQTGISMKISTAVFRRAT